MSDPKLTERCEVAWVKAHNEWCNPFSNHQRKTEVVREEIKRNCGEQIDFELQPHSNGDMCRQIMYDSDKRLPKHKHLPEDITMHESRIVAKCLHAFHHAHHVSCNPSSEHQQKAELVRKDLEKKCGPAVKVHVSPDDDNMCLRATHK